jgi:hypothetical protein
MIFIWRLGKKFKLCNWKIRDWIVILTLCKLLGLRKGVNFWLGIDLYEN